MNNADTDRVFARLEDVLNGMSFKDGVWTADDENMEAMIAVAEQAIADINAALRRSGWRKHERFVLHHHRGFAEGVLCTLTVLLGRYLEDDLEELAEIDFNYVLEDLEQ